MSVDNLPLVSVAVITYNQKEFLRECIESILAQDYPNMEIVIADDASIDGTQIMLRDYDGQYPDKFVLKLAEKNQGITANSNVAHFACTGKYIAWIGGDDLMLPGKISKQVEFMESNPDCTICYHQHEAFNSKTGEVLYRSFDKYKKRKGDIRCSIKYGTFNGALASMVRREKTPINGFNSFVPVASDWLYWVETLANGGTIDYIDDILARHRRHENNVTNRGGEMGQNSIDHMNSCNLILKSHPEYFEEVLYRYGSILIENRLFFPYIKNLWCAFKLTKRLDALGAIVLFVITFGVIKK